MNGNESKRQHDTYWGVPKAPRDDTAYIRRLVRAGKRIPAGVYYIQPGEKG